MAWGSTTRALGERGVWVLAVTLLLLPAVAHAQGAAGNVLIAWDDRREEQHRVHLALARDGVVERNIELGVAGRSPALAAGADAWLAWQREAGPVARRFNRR